MVCFDYFQSLVYEGGGFDGNFWAHFVVGVF